MQTDDFDFDLPDDRIALGPCEPRDHAQMLVVEPGRDPQVQDKGVRDLPSLLTPGDLLVVNDTRVIPAALKGIRRRNEDAIADIHTNLVRRLDQSRWLAFARPGRRLKVGDRVRFGDGVTSCLTGALDATVAAKRDGGLVELTFDLAGPDLDAAISSVGAMPLPPYIEARRPATDADRSAYQTVFAERDGAVASPTAGLHFTPALLSDLADRGIGSATITLHVGAGTFLPVKSDTIDDHTMHSEWAEITPETAGLLNATRQAGGRIIAVGTTVLRTLETAAREDGTIAPFAGETDIFIKPGYRFCAVDVLMTNFHLPRSTLFMLVAAFSGLETMKSAYAHAIAAEYRFYSYGDSTLLFPKVPTE